MDFLFYFTKEEKKKVPAQEFGTNYNWNLIESYLYTSYEQYKC